MLSYEQKLLEKYGIELPESPLPGGKYVPVTQTGELLYVSGQVPKKDGKLVYKGRVGEELSIQEGQEAAKLATLNCLSQVKAYLGSLDKIEKIIQVIGYVRSSEGFTQQPAVMDAASEMLINCFGEVGKHTRLALGTSELPGGAAVEVTMIIEIKTEN